MTATHPFRLTQALVLAATVAALAAPAVALGTSGKPATAAQLSPTERIARQEDARRRDPAIYGGTWVAGYPGPGPATQQLTPTERIVRQENARLHDPAIYGGTWAAGFPAPVSSPAIEIVAAAGFDWLDAGLGAGAALATVAAVAGARVLVRTGGLVKA